MRLQLLNVSASGVLSLSDRQRGVVYVLRNMTNGKEYVGGTTRAPEDRWLEHVRAADSGSTLPVHAALAKYGAGLFAFNRLWEGPAEQLAEREVHYIRTRNTNTPFGYNLQPGGEGLQFFTPEERAQRALQIKKLRAEPLRLPCDLSVCSSDRRWLLSVHGTKDRKICVLSVEEAIQFAFHQLPPPGVHHHPHIRRSVAEKGLYKFLEDSAGRRLIVVVRLNEWIAHNTKRGWLRRSARLTG